MLLEAARLTVAHRETAGVTLSCALADPMPRLRADHIRLKQMLVALLSNACKFTPPGGSVTISASNDADGGLALSVADTGIGMRAEDIPAALSLFVQLDLGPGRRAGGTGLGLPLTRRLIEQHGGRLELDSAPGRGTVATLHFPPERVLAGVV